MVRGRRIKAFTDVALRPVGLRLVRSRDISWSKWFYPTASSCQIVTLSRLFERFLGSRTSGLFVEVGAFDGISYSNTWGLAEQGWEGLMVEPIPDLAAKCRHNHRNHPRVHVVETAIGDHQGVASLVLAGALTTANHDQAAEYRRMDFFRASVPATDTLIDVPMTTLDSLLEDREVPAEFDLLVVDVEGYEGAVFAGFSLARWSPKMLIVELMDTHPELSLTAAADAQLSTEIQAVGYRIVYKDHINTVFVREQLFTSAYGDAPS